MPDQLPPQPPPNAPAPPPSEEALLSRSKMDWILVIGIIAVILCLMLLLVAPMMVQAAHKGARTEAMANAKQIGLALFEFDQAYGKYPEAATAAAVRLKTGSTLTLAARTSNDLFAQLLASGIISSERNFYAKAKSMRKPDNVFHTDATILEHGECAFAYIVGLSSSDNPGKPILFGPVIPGTTTLDLKSCDGKAVVLRLDNSVTALPINPAGKILDHGIDLLDPRQPYWHGKAPDVKWAK